MADAITALKQTSYYADCWQDIVPTITQHPGITGVEIAKLLMDGKGITKQMAHSVINYPQAIKRFGLLRMRASFEGKATYAFYPKGHRLLVDNPDALKPYTSPHQAPVPKPAPRQPRLAKVIAAATAEPKLKATPNGKLSEADFDRFVAKAPPKAKAGLVIQLFGLQLTVLEAKEIWEDLNTIFAPR
jgi:hypothetical protein